MLKAPDNATVLRWRWKDDENTGVWTYVDLKYLDNITTLENVEIEFLTPATPPEFITNERKAFNGWNNEIDCPLAGVDVKTAAWRGWSERATREAQENKGFHLPAHIHEALVMITNTPVTEAGEHVGYLLKQSDMFAIDWLLERDSDQAIAPTAPPAELLDFGKSNDASYRRSAFIQGWTAHAAWGEEITQLAAALVDEYLCNPGKDSEFIACITPSSLSIGTGGVWDMWKKLYTLLESRQATVKQPSSKQRAMPLSHAYKTLTPTFIRNHLDVYERYGIMPDNSVMIPALRIALDGMERTHQMIVPPGFKIAPAEASMEMIQAASAHHEGEFYLPASLYKSMMEVIPTPAIDPALLSSMSLVWLNAEHYIPTDETTVLVKNESGVVWIADVDHGQFYPDEFPVDKMSPGEVREWARIPDGETLPGMHWTSVTDATPDPKSPLRICAFTPTERHDLRYRLVSADVFKMVCTDATHWLYVADPMEPNA